jgi:predicted nucleic acid-binding protein
MTVAAAVSDASPLIVFHQFGRLDLVRAVLGEVLIPSAVAREIAPSLGDPPPWMRVMGLPSPRDPFPWEPTLDPGEAEAEAIALAPEVSAGQILLDDRPARRTAEQLGLFVVGALGLLLEAQRQGFVSDVWIELDAVIDAGFNVGRSLYVDVLALAQEHSG